MLNILQSGKGRQTLIKGSLLALLIVGVLAIINYNNRDSINTGTITKRAVKPIGDGPDTKPPKPWNSTYRHNPCYEQDDKLFCGPGVYLIGFQNAGLNLLKQAMGLHPNVDCYSTGFFSSFSNIKDIKMSDMENYLSLFEDSAKKIQSGSDLCICDSGRALARPYELEISNGVVSRPEYTTAAALAKFYRPTKTIVIVRDPTDRFVQEYCALGIATPFEEYVDDAISGFLDCENNVTRDNASCVYDASLSGLLQAGLYNFLIKTDHESYFSYDYATITFDRLVNPESRRVIMISIFNYLERDIPSYWEPVDPYWDAVDALFAPWTRNCHGQVITNTAKRKLRDFYSAR